jgi:hypothetical protein
MLHKIKCLQLNVESKSALTNSQHRLRRMRSSLEARFGPFQRENRLFCRQIGARGANVASNGVKTGFNPVAAAYRLSGRWRIEESRRGAFALTQSYHSCSRQHTEHASRGNNPP